MPNLFEALNVLGAGLLVVCTVMLLLALGIWVMGRTFIAVEKRNSKKLAAKAAEGGDK